MSKLLPMTRQERDANERWWAAFRRDSLIAIDPAARAGKPPCGECHLKPGETCDICGAKAGTDGGER